MEALNPQDVQKALDQFNLGIQVRFFSESTATSELAAAAIGCVVGQIAKSICIMVDERPILAVTSGDQRVDLKKIAALHEVSNKRVRMANAEECISIYGYAPGGVPPLGHRTVGLAVLLDSNLQRYPTIYGAAGSADSIFPIQIEHLPLITGGRFADFTKDPA